MLSGGNKVQSFGQTHVGPLRLREKDEPARMSGEKESGARIFLQGFLSLSVDMVQLGENHPPAGCKLVESDSLTSASSLRRI
jgi:hypothetical protein